MRQRERHTHQNLIPKQLELWVWRRREALQKEAPTSYNTRLVKLSKSIISDPDKQMIPSVSASQVDSCTLEEETWVCCHSALLVPVHLALLWNAR